MEKTTIACILIPLISFGGIIECASLAVSVPAWHKLGYIDSGESFAAMNCNGVTIIVSFIALFSVALPASLCICSKDDDNCCTPTFFASVVVAGSISVIGTTVAGLLQIFTVYNYEDILSDSELSSYGRAAASLNFIAAIFGVIIIVTTLFFTCLEGVDNWYCCKEESKCT